MHSEAVAASGRKLIGNLVHLRDLRADILRQNSQVAQHAHGYAALDRAVSSLASFR